MAATGEAPVAGYSDESVKSIINATSGYDRKAIRGRDLDFMRHYYNGAERSPELTRTLTITSHLIQQATDDNILILQITEIIMI